MSVQVEPPLVEDCQRVTLPVIPVRLIVPELLVAHTDAPPDVDPPTDRGLIDMIAGTLFAEGQTPLRTTALNWVA